VEEIDQAEGFEHRRTCVHVWQPVSFVFERELSTVQQRALNSPLNMLDPAGGMQPRMDIVPQVRMPDPQQGRVYCVCMKCASHTYITTQFVGFQLGGDCPAKPDEEIIEPQVDSTRFASSQAKTTKELQRILFWADIPGHRPQDFVRSDVPEGVRDFLVHVLIEGESVASYKGSAKCRMCSATLGSDDLSAYGFIWPQGAEHYIMEHAVWTPECELLIERATQLETSTP